MVPACAERGPRADRGGFVFGRAERDLAGVPPAAYLYVGREVVSKRLDPLPAGRPECQLDPPVAPLERLDAADFDSLHLYGSGVQPAVNRGVGGEVAPARQDSLTPACVRARLPAQFGAAICKPVRCDAPGSLAVALRLGGRRQVGGDDRDDCGQGGEGGDCSGAGHRRLFRLAGVATQARRARELGQAGAGSVLVTARYPRRARV